MTNKLEEMWNVKIELIEEQCLDGNKSRRVDPNHKILEALNEVCCTVCAAIDPRVQVRAGRTTRVNEDGGLFVGSGREAGDSNPM
jgi:hypothetical protein